MKKCVVYARQSFGAEEGSVSLDVQIAACKAWATKNNAQVIGIYQDANTSSELYPACTEGIEAARCDRGFQTWRKNQITKGRKEYKQGLGEAFDCIKAQKPDYICVYTSNRLGRSATNSNLNNFITSYLMEYNTSIVDVQSNSITDFSDSIMLAFRMMKDALDYHSVEEKRKASMDSVARRINSHRVYSNAFGVIMQNGNVTFDSEKAQVVKYVYDSILEGASYNSILKALNEQYRHLAIGKQYYTTNIYDIASNIVYCGYSKDREGNIDKSINTPQPIISYTQWAEVQRLMEERRNQAVKYNTREGEGKHFLPYSGLLYCPCGRRLMLQLDGGVSYRCVNGGAEGEHIKRIRVDDNFLTTMQSLFMISVIDAEKELYNLRTASNESDSIRAKITAAESSLKAKMRMIESDEDYDLFAEEIKAKKAEIKELKAKLLEQEARQGENLDALQEAVKNDFMAIASGTTLDKVTYQRLLAKTIEKIVVYDDKVTVSLKDANVVEIPRLTVDKRGRKTLPASQMSILINDITGTHTVDITFGKGKEYNKIEGNGYVVRIAR